MNWLRRNWPDLAIGIALVAVIAGIVATLITGGSFFPVTPAAPSPAPTAPVTEPPPAEPPVADAPPANDIEVAPAVEVEAPDAAEPSAVVDAPAVADAPPPVTGSVSVLTPDGQEVETPPPTPVPTPAPVPAPPTPAVAPEPPAEPAPVAAEPPPAPAAEPVAVPPVAADEAVPYRVSVGAFGNPDNAARQAQVFRNAGYPVFTGVQGNLTIVLVGPYETEAEASRIATRIAAGGFGIEPVVYRYRPDAASHGASAPAPEAPVPAPAAPAPTPAPTPAPAPTVAPAPAVPTASGRSLQVGAFADAASAVPLRERLASLGLVAFEIREDGLVKLLVGPFDEARLAEVRRQLAEQGIESFPR